MGRTIRISGQQDDRDLRARCLRYMRAVYRYAGQSLPALSDFTAVERMTYVRDQCVYPGIHVRLETAPFVQDCLEGLSDDFIFHGARQGRICGLVRPPVSAHVHLTSSSTWATSDHSSPLPLCLVMFQMIAETFVPGLVVDASPGFDQSWREIIGGIRTPRGFGLYDRPWIRFLARNAPEVELPQLTVELHRAAQAYAMGHAVQADWQAVALAEMGPIGELGSNVCPTTEIGQLDLGYRTVALLENAGITSVGQLVLHSAPQLLRLRHFGRRSLMDVRNHLEMFGGRLSTVHGAWQRP